MKTQDRFEPFLEPLYIPAFFFLLTWIFDGALREVAFHAQNGYFYVDLIFLGLCLTLISSVIVAIYEILMIFKVIKSRSLLDGRMKIYSFFRWIFGAVGLMSIAFSIWFIVLFCLTMSSGLVSFHLG